MFYMLRKLQWFFVLFQLVWQMGPFVDSDHPDIKKGTADLSFGDIFHLEILRRVGHSISVMLAI